MFRTWIKLLCAAIFLTAIALSSCGGDDDATTPVVGGDPAQLVPEVQVQGVDHVFRVAGWTHDILDADPIFALIGSATSTLQIAMTRLNRQDVVEALVMEAASGTQIQIVTEKAYYEDPAYQPFYDQLEDVAATGGNIEIVTDLEGLPRLMHSRFIVIDRARVVTGSYNWETADSERTYGDVITITSAEVAEAFRNEFMQMFEERNFGPSKRDDSQHSFLLGSGNGLLEVYFGPIAGMRDRIESEIGNSATALFAVQQFKDTTLANFLLGWLSSGAGQSLIGVFNDFGELGDVEENAVYRAFWDYGQAPTGGNCYLNGLAEDLNGDNYLSNGEMHLIDWGDLYNEQNTMNHKVIFADKAYQATPTDTIGPSFIDRPSLIFTTANFSDLAFTQNDEVLLIMRGVPMVNKYFRGIDMTNTTPPDVLNSAGDVQEIDQILAMYPYNASADAPALRDFPEESCGIVFGRVRNFEETITIETDDGEFQDLDQDLMIELQGTTLLGGFDYGRDPTEGGGTPVVVGDFEPVERFNDGYRYLLVVPAGDVTVWTIPTVEESANTSLYDWTPTTFEVGPGGVINIDLSVSTQLSQESGGTGGGGGGGGLG